MASVTLQAAPVVTLSPNRPSSSSAPISRISFSNSESLGTLLTISTSSLSVSTAPSASTLFSNVLRQRQPENSERKTVQSLLRQFEAEGQEEGEGTAKGADASIDCEER
ncbi:hypothetical protein SLEP1_g31869 [Rubroshorea leprosula]|uniref:Uncharacterized protein n=1 Tax=Rubroshorea leprosula TaxID=152421 RepID=A0AAV5KBJ5_9ROSI|nr:hypothetical protein SLEP1_g31869 [Rubroshorea leprosula]